MNVLNQRESIFGGSGGAYHGDQKTTTYMVAASYLPFVKQSSICEESFFSQQRGGSNIQSSSDPFENAFEMRSYKRESTITTAISDIPGEERAGGGEELTNSYINATFGKWRQMYI
jgi:hypothetical protein